jgi:tetratricopeptide (TPR) repeat protein
MYAGLAGTWVFLAWLMARWSQRGGVVGLGLGVSPWEYALTQCRAIILYLRLSVWPSPLVVDYGTGVVQRVGDVWLQGVVLVALVAGTFWALWRRPVLGFLAFSFFAILAPSSSVVPLISQTIAEHRMYLPLAVLLILAVVGGYRWLGRRSLAFWLVVAVLAAGGTAWRNRDYRDPLTLWGVTVAAQPDNPRAQMNYGTALSAAGRLDEAREHFAEAAHLSPIYAEAHYSLAGVLLQLNRPAEAAEHAGIAVKLKPGFAEAHYVLGTALLQQRQLEPALAQYAEALRLKPDFADAEHTLAGALAMAGRPADAMAHYEAALRLQPNNAQLYQEVGNLLARSGRLEEAVANYGKAVELAPDLLISQFNLGHALADLQRWGEAAEHFAAAARLRPDFPDAHNFLGRALMELGRLDEAQAEIAEALRLRPDFPPARENWERLAALRAAGRR